jgi:ADP-ribose pyrophosphatase YjhB (NUDIX family)
MTRYCWRCATPLAAVPPTTCGSCGEVHYVNPKPCGNAVAVHAGQVLMLLRAAEPAAGTWTVPGGFCEADEHPMRAAERELAEETGLAGRATAYLGTWMDGYGPPAGDGLAIHTAVSGYLVELADPAAAPRPQPGEALEVRWFALDALPEAIAFPAHIPAMLTTATTLLRGGVRQPLYDREW